MLNIRHSVYETNSSSSHCVVIAPGDTLDLAFSQEALRKGLVTIRPDHYYGRGYKRIRTPEGKLAYLLVVAAGGYIDARDKKDLLPSMIEEPGVRKIVAAVKKLTGCDIEVLYDPQSNDKMIDGYIMAEVRNGFDVDPSDLKTLNQLLFSSKSYIETGDGESDPPFRIKTDIGDDVRDGCEFYDLSIFNLPSSADRWFKLKLSDNDVVAYVDDEGHEHSAKVNAYRLGYLFGEGHFLAVATECSVVMKEFRDWNYETLKKQKPDIDVSLAEGRKVLVNNELFSLLCLIRNGRNNLGPAKAYMASDMPVKIRCDGITNTPIRDFRSFDSFEITFKADQASLEIVRAELVDAYMKPS
jgi:hypothetical protein